MTGTWVSPAETPSDSAAVDAAQFMPIIWTKPTRGLRPARGAPSFDLTRGGQHEDASGVLNVIIGGKLAARLRVGMVTINGGAGVSTDAPMGGVGISGIGPEIGKRGVREYLEPQNTQRALRRGE